MTIALALAAAVLWGVWSFGTGLVGRRMPIFGVILVSGGVAGLVYIASGLLAGNLVFASEDVIPGLLGGSLNLFGTVLALKAFAKGKMAIVAALSGTGVLVPLAFSFMIGESLSLLAGLGVVVMLVGMILFTLNRANSDGSASAPGQAMLLALSAALLWGLAIVVLDMGSRTNLYGTMTMSEVPQVAICMGVIAASRAFGPLTKGSFALLIGAGAALGLGSVAFYTAANRSDIGIVSVLASLDPIFTALLARVVLHERMSRPELAALVVVIAGVGMVVS